MPNEGPSTPDYTDFLLTSSTGDSKTASALSKSLASREGAASEQPSVLSKIFSTLMIPTNIMTGVDQALAAGVTNDDKGGDDSFLDNLGQELSGVGKSLAGGAMKIADVAATFPYDLLPGDPKDLLPDGLENKIDSAAAGYRKIADNLTPDRSHEDVLHDTFGVDNKVARYGGGIALDIATDPLNLVPGLGFVKGKKAKDAIDVLDAKAAAPESMGLSNAFGAEKLKSLGIKLPTATPKAVPVAEKTAHDYYLEADEFSKWTKAEDARLTQQYRDSNGVSTFPREVGRKLTEFRKARERLLEAGSWTDPSGANQLGMPLVDVIPEFSHLVDEFAQSKRAPGSLFQGPITDEALKGTVLRAPLTFDQAVPRQNVIPNVNPISDIFENAIKFQPRNRVSAGQSARVSKAQSVRDSLSPVIDDVSRTPIQRFDRKQKDWERAMSRSGVVATSATKVSMRAADNVVQKILNGEVPRLQPKIQGATGEAAVKAKELADEMIDDLMGPKRLQGKFAKRNKIAEVNAGHQIGMFAKIIGKAAPGKIDDAVAMLRSAEDHMLSLGVQPVRDGVRVRLSDVFKMTEGKVGFDELLNSFKMKDVRKMNPVVREAIQTLEAQRTFNTADMISNLTKYATKAKGDVTQQYVGKQLDIAIQDIVDKSVAQGVALGFTNKEAHALTRIIKDVVRVDQLPDEEWLQAASTALTKAVDEGKAQPALMTKFNKAVAESYGQKLADDAIQRVVGGRTSDRIMGSMATWWGKGDFHKIAAGKFKWGERNAEMRAATMRHITKSFSIEERRAAWKIAAGHIDDPDPRANELASFFKNYMDAVLKVQEHGTKLHNISNKSLSVAERSNMMMHDVNRHLKDMNGPQAFQFTNSSYRGKNSRDAWGNAQDYSQGSDWMKSWGRWDPEDPAKLMYDLDLALERTTKEYAFLDDFAATFGSMTKTGTHSFGMSLGRIKDVYVEPEIGRQLTRTMEDIYKGSYKPSNDFGRYYGKALRLWKTGVTIYLPSHHIRNAIGDINLMWLAGHNDPRAFMRAKRIISSQRTRYKEAVKSGDFDEVAKLTDPEAFKYASTDARDVVLKRNGISLTADQIYVAAHQRGLLLDADRLEDIFGEQVISFGQGNRLAGTKLGELVKQPLGGKAHTVATKSAEYREHYIRLAHFNSAIDKALRSGRKDLQKIFDDASYEVKKWHPDGTDLTLFEQKYMRNIIPFYSWMRKSTPLLIESLLTRPAKTLAYPRINVATQNMLGVDATMEDPFPDDQLFPEWIRGYGIGPIGDAQSDNSISNWWGNLGKNMIDPTGDPYGYTVVNPSLPFIDSGQQFLGFGPKDTGAGLLDSLTPFAKVPIDLTKNSDFTGAPITKDEGGKGVVNYLAKQFPFVSPVQRVMDFGEKERVGAEPGRDWEALINMLTAAGVHGTAPYIKGAEFEARDRMKRAREEGK